MFVNCCVELWCCVTVDCREECPRRSRPPQSRQENSRWQTISHLIWSSSYLPPLELRPYGRQDRNVSNVNIISFFTSILKCWRYWTYHFMHRRQWLPYLCDGNLWWVDVTPLLMVTLCMTDVYSCQPVAYCNIFKLLVCFFSSFTVEPQTTESVEDVLLFFICKYFFAVLF